MSEHIRDEYETVAEQYNTSFQLAYRIHVEQYTTMQALSQIGGVAGKTVLDIACGTGHYTRLLRQQGATRVVGIDLSPDMIRVAQRTEQENPLGGITYHVADAGALDAYGTFDLAVAVYLFHYAQSPAHLRNICQGIAHNLRSGATFVTYGLHPNLCLQPDYYLQYGVNIFAPTTPLQDGDQYTFAFRMQDSWSPQIPVYYWSFQAMEQALQQARFTNIRWQDAQVAAEGIAEHGSEFWRAYQDCPHCTLLIANKQ